jgi:hypothetical protein
MTQPHGYCTLVGCDENTCPSEAVCVRFWPQVGMQSDADRVGTNYCMYKCKSQSSCRNGDGYSCVSSKDFGSMEESKIIGGDPNQRFCALRRPPIVDAGPPDSGQPDAADIKVDY